MGDGLKFTVRYQRKIQTRPYENMTIGLEMEFPNRERWDSAFKVVKDTVERWIDECLNGERR